MNSGICRKSASQQNASLLRTQMIESSSQHLIVKSRCAIYATLYSAHIANLYLSYCRQFTEIINRENKIVNKKNPI